VLVVFGILGIHADDQQEVAGRLGDGQALLLHFLRQQGGGRLQLVLHLHLGDVDVGAGLEGQGRGGRARAVAGRRHVVQAVQALHLLFDDLGDAVLDGLGRGAGIDGDTDTWGRAMSGYWAIGRLRMASPASMMTIATTHAKMGRSMKKRESMADRP
jgi:hypothetical protein